MNKTQKNIFKNIESFKSRLSKRLKENPNKNLLSTIGRSTMLVQGSAVSSIQAGGTGETVQKYNPRRTHTQSAPNQPPATDTGFLVSNITMDIEQDSRGSIIGRVISSAPYSQHLEFGTTNMTERPFMQPALEKNRRKIFEIFKNNGLLE